MRAPALALAAVSAATLVPTAAAQPRANVVSWSPNVVSPGEPVSVVLTLADARPRLRPTDVVVVIRGTHGTRRFATAPLDAGRYRTEIVFPAAGPWNVLVQYGRRDQ